MSILTLIRASLLRIPVPSYCLLPIAYRLLAFAYAESWSVFYCLRALAYVLAA